MPKIQIITSTTTTVRGGVIIPNIGRTSRNTASGCRCKRRVFRQRDSSGTAGSRKFKAQSYEGSSNDTGTARGLQVVPERPDSTATRTLFPQSGRNRELVGEAAARNAGKIADYVRRYPDRQRYRQEGQGVGDNCCALAGATQEGAAFTGKKDYVSARTGYEESVAALEKVSTA